MQIIIQILEMRDYLDFTTGTKELLPTMQIENYKLPSSTAASADSAHLDGHRIECPGSSPWNGGTESA